MPTYTILARVLEQRAFEVEAESQDEAEEIFSADWTAMDSDLIDAELDEYEVQE